MSKVLLEMGVGASQHRDALEEVKRQVGITHENFDCWIYNFLENKNFDIGETVSKLRRRADMERNELVPHEFTAAMRENMAMGIIQLIGEDRDGRVAFYITTKRDFPKASMRDERRKSFDMWLSYGTRLRRDNKRCRITMLINQEDASVWSNVDMAFQSNIALRVAKFYPGVVDKMYICNMGKTLSTFAKPIFSRLPAAVSERIFIITESEIQAGKLLQLFDENVLPVALGGKNDCDNQANWTRFASTIEEYWGRLSAGIRSGMSVKDWELEQLRDEEEEPHPSPHEASHRSRSRSMAGDETATMRTCISDTEDDDEHAMRSIDEVSFYDEEAHPSTLPGIQAMMLRDRAAVEREEHAFRMAMLMQCGSERRLLADKPDNILDEPQTNSIVNLFPTPVRSVVKGALWILCLIIAAYFMTATAFLAMVCSAMTATCFFGMFAQWYNVWPLGILCLFMGYQQMLICSRGFGLAHTSFRGFLIQPLGRFGGWGHVVQMLLCALIVLGQLIVFIYWSVTSDPVTALKVSFSTGWMTCLVIIAIFHFGFPVGLRESPPSTADKRVRGDLGLYLFFDITEQDEPHRTRRSAIVVSMVPVIFSVLFGIAFIFSNQLFFLVATPITAVGAAATVNFFASQRERDLRVPLVTANTWLLTLAWIFFVFAVGMIEMTTQWRAAVAATISVVLCLVAICAGTLNIPRKYFMRALRGNFAFMAVLCLGGIVIAGVAHWGLAIVLILLILHAIASSQSPGHTNFAGAMLTILGGLLCIIAVQLLGQSALYTPYAAPRSVGPVINRTDVRRSALFNQYPVCLARFERQLGAADFALFSQLAYARSDVLDRDLGRWFPGFTYQGEFVADEQIATFREFSDGNVTVLAFRGPNGQMPALLAVLIWIEALALTPLTISLPQDWIAPLIDVFAALQGLINFPWRGALVNAEDAVSALAARSNTSLVLTGSGLGGAAATIIGSRRQIAAVALSSPGLYYSRIKLGLPLESLQVYAASIVAANSALGTIDNQGDAVQRIDCTESITGCSEISFLVRRLLSVCGSNNRSFSTS